MERRESDSGRRRSHFDVVIVGMGPVGAVCANLMGKYGVKTIVFEKEQEIYNGPRAVAVDAETTRFFGLIDLDDWLDEHVSKTGYQVLTGPEGNGWPIVDLEEVPKEHGYSKISYFYQPTVEATLRKNVKKYPNVQVCLGYEVTDIVEGRNGLVHVKVKFIGGLNEEVYTCKYLLGCDGGKSTVRRRLRLRYDGKADVERWLVLDIHSKSKQLKDQWSKFTFVIAGKRPYLHTPLPGDYHRFELLLDDHEDAEDMTKLEKVESLLNSIDVDTSHVTFQRRIVYKFHSREVEQWNVGHTFLLGDAAHCLPPFRGQGSTGMCSGIRDVVNLCWKITLFLHGTTEPLSLPRIAEPAKPETEDRKSTTTTKQEIHLPQSGVDRLSDSYQVERSPHVALMTRHATIYGTFTKLRNPVVTLARDVIFYLMAQLPFVQLYLLEDGGKPAPTIISGLIDWQSKSSAGKMFPQPYVVMSGERKLFDKVLGIGFAVIGWERNPKQNLSLDSQSKLSSLGCKFITIDAGHQTEPHSRYFQGSVSVIDVDGVIESWCKEHQAKLILLRPDRCVFGHADNSIESGNNLIGRFYDMLTGKQPLTIRKSNPTVVATFWDKCSVLTAVVVVVAFVGLFVLLYLILF